MFLSISISDTESRLHSLGSILFSKRNIVSSFQLLPMCEILFNYSKVLLFKIIFIFTNKIVRKITHNFLVIFRCLRGLRDWRMSNMSTLLLIHLFVEWNLKLTTRSSISLRVKYNKNNIPNRYNAVVLNFFCSRTHL